jgi:integrase
MSIDNDQLFKEFLDRGIKESTQIRYKSILQHYTDSTGLTPTELIEEAENEEDQAIRLRKRKIKKHLETHLQYLQDKDFSPKYIQISMTCIRTFYYFFDLQLPRVKITTNKEPAITTDDIPSREEIRRALTEANAKFEAIIVLQISSGMGLSEVLSLQIKDLLKGCKLTPNSIDQLAEIDRENTIIEWTVTRKKTGQTYWTFSTPEATGRIMDYLDKHPPDSLETHIFRGEKGKYKDMKLQDVSMLQYFIWLNDKCGFGKVGRQRKFRSHALRKYFANTLESHNCPHLAIRMMMGHKTGDKTTSAYFLPDQERLLKEYKKVMEHLTIYEKLKVYDNTEEIVKEQDEKIKLQDDRIAELERMMILKDKEEVNKKKRN